MRISSEPNVAVLPVELTHPPVQLRRHDRHEHEVGEADREVQRSAAGASATAIKHRAPRRAAHRIAQPLDRPAARAPPRAPASTTTHVRRARRRDPRSGPAPRGRTGRALTRAAELARAGWPPMPGSRACPAPDPSIDHDRAHAPGVIPSPARPGQVVAATSTSPSYPDDVPTWLLPRAPERVRLDGRWKNSTVPSAVSSVVKSAS